ncbi:F-box/LRR-repeat protein 4-like isoform X1 [Amphibalanus amphitrite]|nr:F-box/LRR-repeat protein 4-like isoform X1 [Amphibalanus amphitrite]XP_043193601.1 F-box/LRR-repeat protein 4-like isoform X1 [Amphibalanus amphitrite]XP_043193602.1 F-box/LRR-repeat protein 4-like isoform X1 [Amphibalanus amphitrite]
MVCSSDDGDLEQYASSVAHFSSQYGGEGTISYTVPNIIGPPSQPGVEGDFASSAVLATYGTWWDDCPSGRRQFSTSAPLDVPARDFIDVGFDTAVYVLSVRVFECYHPGGVCRLWARWEEPDGPRWTLLWRRRPGAQPEDHRQPFSPPLKILRRPVRQLRLELNCDHLGYYTGLDAVQLVGCVRPPSPARLLRGRPLRPLSARLFALMPTVLQPEELQDRVRELAELGRKAEEEERRQRRECPTPDSALLQLPEEIICRVLSCLDLVSLSRLSLTCRHLHRLCSDPLLYSQLDLQPYWHLVDTSIVPFLTSRASCLTKLDLSWCGNYGALSDADFCNLLSELGSRLVSLRVDACDWFNGLCMEWTGLFCRGLEELSLRSCRAVVDDAFWSLQYLCNLRRVDLYRTQVTAAPLATFIRNATGLQHLGLGLCERLQRLWHVCEALGECSADLRSLVLWKQRELSWAELRHIQSCRRLEELDLGWCRAAVQEGELPFLRNISPFFPNLKKLFLTSLRMIQDGDLQLIAEHNRQMQQLDILGASLVRPEAVESVLSRCPDLRLLDVSFCAQVSEAQVALWRHLYPHCSIKRSYRPA